MGMFTEVRPEIDSPEMVESELVNMIENIRNPRDGYDGIGCSEVGTCAKRLIHKILKHRPPRQYNDRWAAMVGTFGHAGLERGMTDAQERMQLAEPRYLTEYKVKCGYAAGSDIIGTADLFDTMSGTVVDWKFVGPTPLLKYKQNGPGNQYRVQAMLYGRGFALLGYDVRQVMIAFLPRSGALGSSRFKRGADGTPEWENRGQRFFWSEPYDESIALAALARLNGLYELLKMMDAETLLASFPDCSDYFCPWCGR